MADERDEVVTNQFIGTVPTNWHIAGTADVNGDGKSDVVWSSDAGGSLVWEMNGTQVTLNELIGPGSTPASPPLQTHVASAAGLSAAEPVTLGAFALPGADASGLGGFMPSHDLHPLI